MKQSNIKINWIFYFANRFISYIVPLILVPYVSRILGAEGVGINSYTMANVTYFTMFCMLGISGYGKRTVAICRNDKQETSKVFWELSIIHGMASALILFLYLLLISCSEKYKIYYVVNLITVLSAVIDVNWFFEAYEKFRFLSVRNCVLKVLTLFLTFLFVNTKEDLVLYIGINALTVFLANFSLVFELKKYIVFIPLKKLNWKIHMKEVLIYFIPTIAASVFSVLDKSVINWITKSDIENGYYEQAYKIYLAINAFVHSLEGVLAPRMSYLFVNGTKQEFENKINEAIKCMLLLAMPCAFGMIAIAPSLIPVFLGEGFEKTIPILYIFMPLIIVVGMNVYIDGLYLVPSGQRKKSAGAVCVGAVSNLFLNVILVMRWKALGAAVATLITEMILNSIMLYLSKGIIDRRRLLSSVVRYGIDGIVIFLGVRFVGRLYVGTFSFILQIVIGINIYVLLLFIQREPRLMQIINQLHRKRKRKNGRYD